MGSGGGIGGGMYVYTTKTENKAITKKLIYPDTSGNHNFAFLLIDQNRYVDIYAIASLTGAKTILKTSDLDAPSLSGTTIVLPLSVWATAFLITNEAAVSIS